MKVQLPIGHIYPLQTPSAITDNLASAKRTAMEKLSEVTAARKTEDDSLVKPFSTPPVRGHHIDIRC